MPSSTYKNEVLIKNYGREKYTLDIEKSDIRDKVRKATDTYMRHAVRTDAIFLVKT